MAIHLPRGVENPAGAATLVIRMPCGGAIVVEVVDVDVVVVDGRADVVRDRLPEQAAAIVTITTSAARSRGLRASDATFVV